MLENRYDLTKTEVIDKEPADESREDTDGKGLDGFSENYSGSALKEVLNKYNISNDSTAISADKDSSRDYLALTQLKSVVAPEPTAAPVPDLNASRDQSTLDQNTNQTKNVFIKNKSVKPALNFTGRVIICAYASIMILLGGLMIANTVTINKMSSDISALNQNISEENYNITDVKKVYDVLNKADNLTDRATDSGMEPSSDVKYVTMLSVLNGNAPTAKTNWFDALCNFLSKTFGG